MIEQEPLLGDMGNISDSHIYHVPGIYQPEIAITNDNNFSHSKSLEVFVAKKVEITWNFESPNSAIDLKGDGSIKVAILGTENFDTATIDSTSIRVDDEQDSLLNSQDNSSLINVFQLKDTNNDGFLDLEITFSKSSLREVIDSNNEVLIDSDRLYLFGSSSSFKGGFFLGAEGLEN